MPQKSATSDIIDALGHEFENGRFSDLTIICSARSIRVHKMIVCTRSKYFLSMVSNSYQGSTTNSIYLDDDHVATVKRMLSVLYTGDYEVDAFWENPLAAHAKVYVLGAKYEITQVRDVALHKYKQELRSWSEAPGDPLDVINAVSIIYLKTRSEDRRIHEATVEAIASTSLLKDLDEECQKAFDKLLFENAPEFNKDLMARFMTLKRKRDD